MSRYICLKCGSTNVDDGNRPLISVIGAGMILAGVLVTLIVCASAAMADWEHAVLGYDHVACALLISAGLVLLFDGAERNARVKCRKCGKVWTPPRPHLKTLK